jgi:hypothetical protein
LIKKFKKFASVFFLQFIFIKTLDPDPYPDPDSMNPDSQLWRGKKEGREDGVKE